MNQIKHDGIVLKCADKGESDKLLRLLTADGTLIYCVMKGVKKPNAKLKFGAQPFAFCQYILSGSGAYPTVTACSSLGDFYCVCYDSTKYLCGCIMLEAAEVAASAPSAEVFLALLNSLKNLAYTDVNPHLVTAHFIMRLLNILGINDEYADLGIKEIKNINCVFSYLNNTSAQLNEKILIDDDLCFKSLKMLAGKFALRTDCSLNCLKFLHK